MVIKTKAILLRLTRGAYPYDYFKDNTPLVSDIEYKLNYIDTYLSLTYLDNQKALKLHSGERSITQELIVGIVHYNESIKNDTLDRRFMVDLALELKKKADSSENRITFYFDEPYDRFDLNGKYSSGIVQGKAASYFLRCHDVSKEDRFKLWAKNCLLSAWKSIEDGGGLRKLANDQFWVEEYPSHKPSMVLNGYLFYIIGLAEYLSFDNDPAIRSQFEMSLNSVMTWMPNYKLKNGLIYSMYRWGLCNVHYTGIMKYQFEHLYQLTGILVFKEYAVFTDRLTDWKTFDRIM